MFRPHVFLLRRMLSSHQRSLTAAREHNEPAGQIASRELKIVTIEGALLWGNPAGAGTGAHFERYSAYSIRLAQLREECLHGTQALRLVREKDEMISMGDGDHTGCRHTTFN